MINIINHSYCKKLIIILPGQKHPAQFHKVKEESFFILYGTVNLILNKKKYILNPGDLKTIRKKEVHEFFSKKGAEGVGRATTAAVVSSSILILASNYFLTEMLFKP